jgi:hypothetical protein
MKTIHDKPKLIPLLLEEKGMGDEALQGKKDKVL